MVVVVVTDSWWGGGGSNSWVGVGVVVNIMSC
jgi:hypothetical protein